MMDAGMMGQSMRHKAIAVLHQQVYCAWLHQHLNLVCLIGERCWLRARPVFPLRP